MLGVIQGLYRGSGKENGSYYIFRVQVRLESENAAVACFYSIAFAAVIANIEEDVPTQAAIMLKGLDVPINLLLLLLLFSVLLLLICIL